MMHGTTNIKYTFVLAVLNLWVLKTALAHHTICSSVALQINKLHELSYVLHYSLMIVMVCKSVVQLSQKGSVYEIRGEFKF